MKLAGDYVQLALCLMKIDSGKLLSIEILIQHPEDFLTKISWTSNVCWEIQVAVKIRLVLSPEPDKSV